VIDRSKIRAAAEFLDKYLDIPDSGRVDQQHAHARSDAAQAARARRSQNNHADAPARSARKGSSITSLIRTTRANGYLQGGGNVAGTDGGVTAIYNRYGYVKEMRAG
jgi:hypothetical protein